MWTAEGESITRRETVARVIDHVEYPAITGVDPRRVDDSSWLVARIFYTFQTVKNKVSSEVVSRDAIHF